MSDDEIRDLLLNPRTPFEEQLADRLIAAEKARLRRQPLGSGTTRRESHREAITTYKGKPKGAKE